MHDGKVQFVSRNRRDLTKRFPELREVSDLIKARTAIVDGEIVSLDRAGLPSFDALRYRGNRGAVVFYAFDLIYFDGEHLTQYPLVARKAALKRILRKPAMARIRYTEHIEEQDERLFNELEALQLEGMVCKRKTASMQPQHDLNSGFKFGPPLEEKRYANELRIGRRFSCYPPNTKAPQ